MDFSLAFVRLGLAKSRELCKAQRSCPGFAFLVNIAVTGYRRLPPWAIGLREVDVF